MNSLLQQAQAAAAAGNDLMAVALLTQALAADSSDVEARRMRAAVLLRMQQWHEVLADTQLLTTASSPSATDFLLHADAQNALGNNAEALSAYDAAIRLSPTLAEAYLHRGSVKMRLHDNAGAADDLKQALTLKPELAKEADGVHHVR